MNYIDSQQDMRSAYANGATGVLASGLIWCIASVVGGYSQIQLGMLTLFIGGTLIFPLSMLFSKLLKYSGKHAKDNILNHLALESLGFLFAGLFVSFVIAEYNQNLFFPVMLLAIGARYLTFHSLYGLKIYWLLGGLLMMFGFLLAIVTMPFIYAGLLGGLTELLFSLIIYKQAKIGCAPKLAS